MALESGQPIGHLCDLLGIGRFRPGVFDALVDQMFKGQDTYDEAEGDARLASLRHRLTGN